MARSHGKRVDESDRKGAAADVVWSGRDEQNKTSRATTVFRFRTRGPCRATKGRERVERRLGGEGERRQSGTETLFLFALGGQGRPGSRTLSQPPSRRLPNKRRTCQRRRLLTASFSLQVPPPLIDHLLRRDDVSVSQSVRKCFLPLCLTPSSRGPNRRC